jgi:hypothetical protein
MRAGKHASKTLQSGFFHMGMSVDCREEIWILD